MYTLEGTNLIKRMVIPKKSTSSLKRGHVGSLGQILEKSCVPSRGYSFSSKVINLCQNVMHYNIYVRFEAESCRVKNQFARSNRQARPCVLSNRPSFDSKFMKLCQKYILLKI